MQEKEIETFCPASQAEWRKWLEENHLSKQSIWLVYYRIKSGKPTISWSEAVDEALCFGWIDSTKKTIDDESFMQFFCKRKPTSVWSKVNKEKVEQLVAAGLMAEAGARSIAVAKENGSWTMLDEAETLVIPADLERELALHPGAGDFFAGLSKSARKSILQWILFAKREETRQKRIAEIATLAAQRLKPKQFR